MVFVLGCFTSLLALPTAVAKTEAKRSFYSDVVATYALTDNSADARILYATLCVDSEGKPAVYFTKKDRAKKTKRLMDISKTDVQGVPCFTRLKSHLYQGNFVGWIGQWTPYTIDLKFSHNTCIAFRVKGSSISFTQWIPSVNLPAEMFLKITGYKLQLPVEIGRVEGPRDISHGDKREWD